MRKDTILITAFICIIFLLGACTKKKNINDIYANVILGGGHPMEFVIKDANVKEYKLKDSACHDFPVAHIGRKGGSFKISVTNYRWWKICEVSIKTSEDEKLRTVYYTNCNRRKKKHQNHYSDWYDLTLKDTCLYVNIAANKTKLKRMVKIGMTSGDVYSSIYVMQDK